MMAERRLPRPDELNGGAAQSRYSDAEVHAIVDRALARQSELGTTHQELLEIGAELGLSRQTVENAAREVREVQLTEAATARILSRRRRRLTAHAFLFAAVHLVLFSVNASTTPGEWWVLIPLFVWGLLLVAHAVFALMRGISDSALQREKRSHSERLEASSRTRARVPESSASDGRAPDVEQQSNAVEPQTEARTSTNG
jgi:hypothetical protein